MGALLTKEGGKIIQRMTALRYSPCNLSGQADKPPCSRHPSTSQGGKRRASARGAWGIPRAREGPGKGLMGRHRWDHEATAVGTGPLG